MTRREAVSYLLEKRPGDYHPAPDRMQRLMEALGSPQDTLRCIHVAGTNGKGSTCAMLASVLEKAGYRTGLYTSPHLRDFAERIRINGEMIPDGALCEYAARVRDAERGLSLTLAAFDRITAAAFLHFAAEKCDAVVLEVGLGGLLDATNVIKSSAVSIITNIGLDHTAVLGGTLEEIARQKAGIIKPGCPVVSHPQTEGVSRVIADACREKGSPLTVADFSAVSVRESGLAGQVFSYRDLGDLHLPLAGTFQRGNAAVAIEALGVLRRRGFAVSDAALRAGLAGVQWPGRFELLRQSPPFIVDGGHNPQCAAALAESLRAAFGGEKVTFLLSMLADKDAESALGIIAPLANAAVAVTAPDPRALPAYRIAEIMRGHGVTALEAQSFSAAASLCDRMAQGGAVCAFGSLYSVSEIRALFGK